MATTKCDIDPITGDCATHPDRGDCNTRPLGPAPTTIPERTTSLHDLPIFGWAWKGDGRDRRA